MVEERLYPPGMSDLGFAADNAMVTSILRGKVSDQRKFGLPFQMEVVGSVEALGIPNQDTDTVARAYPDLPPFPPPVGPTAVFGLDDLLIGIGLFVAAKLTDKAIDAIGTAVYERIVQPAFDRLWDKFSKRNGAQPPIVARFDHWFDGSKVLVRVLVRSDERDGTPDATLVPAALRRAAEWLRGNPITHRVLTYTVENGELSSQPDLSEPI